MDLGLVPHPSTGLIAKDLDQARLGVDFCTALLDNIRLIVDKSLVRQFEGVVADLQINFVSQK